MFTKMFTKIVKNLRKHLHKYTCKQRRSPSGWTAEIILKQGILRASSENKRVFGGKKGRFYEKQRALVKMSKTGMVIADIWVQVHTIGNGYPRGCREEPDSCFSVKIKM